MLAMLAALLLLLGQAPTPVPVPGPSVVVASQAPNVVIVPAREPARVVWLDRPFVVVPPAPAATFAVVPVRVERPSVLRRAVERWRARFGW